MDQIKTCGACHDDMMADYERSVHARALLKSGLTAAAPSCSSCHGTHEVHAMDEAGSKTNRANIPATRSRLRLHEHIAYIPAPASLPSGTQKLLTR